MNTRFADEDVWQTQAQLVEIYQSSKSNISEHIKHIFEDKELDETVVVRKFRTTTQHGAIEGKTQSRDVAHYNLDVIIAKNYLTELELQRLNLLTSQFLDYAEFQALEQNPMTMPLGRLSCCHR